MPTTATTPKKKRLRKVADGDDGELQLKTRDAIPRLERTISAILLRRFELDIVRLFSTHIHTLAFYHLPRLMEACMLAASPAWIALNSDSDEIKDFFRGALAMDMRQAGERVATKSVLWSYTALRHFAISHSIPICRKRGLHSLRLLPHHAGLRDHLRALNALPRVTFTKPPHLQSIAVAIEELQAHCADRLAGRTPPGWADWRDKVRVGYLRLVDTLWAVAREYDVRGYGITLRDKLTTKWCECGCSTDHLGEVCERTVREDAEETGRRPGKEREWDGRGAGVYGWGSEDEEDIWESKLDFGGALDDADAGDMTVAELMEWRYFQAERQKELGNAAFKRSDFERAVRHYVAARDSEPEMPHYNLNLAAAYLKLSRWADAEAACTAALSQHRSSKGLWRRARARRMQAKHEAAIADLREVLVLAPANADVLRELDALLPPRAPDEASGSTPRGMVAAPPWAPPWAPHPADARRLRVVAVPLTVDGSDAPETFAYAGWDRYDVRVVT